MNILQWNINGLISHKADLLSLLSEINSSIICLQETRLKPTQDFILANYNHFRKDYSGGLIACGGVSISVSCDVPCMEVPLVTELQAVAVRIFKPHSFTVCSLYLPPAKPVDEHQLSALIAQLPSPFFLLGDFNSHSTIWHSGVTDARGRIIETFLDLSELGILNGPFPTHLCSSTGTLSSIDLSLASPALLPRCSWNTMDDLHGSDHFPILIDFLQRIPPLNRLPRWKTEEADWEAYRNLTDLTSINLNAPINLVTEEMNHSILSAAEKSIPKTKPRSNRVLVPWWNEDCARAVQNRKKSLKKFKRHPCSDHLEEYINARKHARFIINSQKRESWRNFVSNINIYTSPTEIWNSVKKIVGRHKYSNHTISILKTPNSILTDPLEIANHLGQHFQIISSDSHYNPQFLEIKRHKESQPVCIQEDPFHPLNRPFSYKEFQEALKSRKDTTPGPDNICIGMIKNLSIESKLVVLKYFNKIFQTSAIPETWTSSISIPILKKNQPSTESSSYRMISLTSSLCKLFEKIIVNRLHWYLETQGLQAQWQSGFRRGRSTRDNVVKLEIEIMEAFRNKRKLLAVFIDIQNAFDTVWRRYIIESLNEIGIHGNILKFIQSFLNNRCYQIRNGTKITGKFTQRNGVPQGSVISPLLFTIVINQVLQILETPVQGMLYADDLVLYCSDKNTVNLQNVMQKNLNILYDWLTNHGFKISQAKTVSVLFSQRKIENPPPIYINDEIVQYKDNTRFLGLIFDRNLNWTTHIKNLKSNCLNSMNILKMLANTSWGADRTSMLMLYRSLIRAKLDYGCMAYGSASPNTLLMLDSVHHCGIRIATGAFRSSPSLSLYAESGEPPLETRRDQLTLSYFLSIKANPSHPLNDTFSNLIIRNNQPTKRQSFADRGLLLIDRLNLSISNILSETCYTKAPWLLPPIQINFSLTKFMKKNTVPQMFQKEFNKILSELSGSCVAFTDGSKSDAGVGAAFLSPNCTKMFSLSPESSVFTAELVAISKALNTITPKEHNLTIFSDSLSALQALQNSYSRHPVIIDILTAIESLRRHGCAVMFQWIPSHCGIKENEEVDNLAKRAIAEGIMVPGITHKDLISSSKRKTLEEWHKKWFLVTENKLREIKSSIRPWKTSVCQSRKEEIVLTRLRIGHTKLTHSYLMSRETTPICRICGTIITVKHILLDCRLYENERINNKLATVLDEVLGDESENVANLLNFVKSTNLINKL